MLTIKAINSYIQQPKEEADQYREAREAETELKEVQTCQLEYLTAGAGSLEDTPKRRSTGGIMETHKELSISLGKFKTSLL